MLINFNEMIARMVTGMNDGTESIQEMRIWFYLR